MTGQLPVRRRVRLAVPVPSASRRSVAVLATLGLAATAVVSGATLASAAPPAPTPATRAGLDPAIVAGRGADLGFTELEAENAATNGTVLAPSRDAYTLASEASGRSAVTLAPGQYVELRLPRAANALTIRYSIPDAPAGGGLTSPLVVKAPGGPDRTVTLTSQYSWLYNAYPFSNDPRLTTSIEPDWWTVECGCAPGATTTFPAPFRPFHFYDEQRVLLGRTVQAGQTIRLTAPAGAAATTLDVVDTQLVGLPKLELKAVNVLLFGADPTGRRDSADAIDHAIAFAQRVGLPVYLPPGTFQVNRHLVVDHVTIEGAGSWYTILKGHQVTLPAPAADGSTHTGVGVYGKDASAGGSHGVHLSGFAIEGDVRERIDTDQVNAIGGALSDSTVDGLYLHHTKVGVWIDGPASNLRISDTQIADQIADGVNFHTGVTDSSVRNTFVRNTGDDALAMWSDKVEDARNSFDHVTVQTPTLANAVAFYGGTDNTLSNSLLADPQREGSTIHAGSRFGAQAFTGHLWITDNTTVRGGNLDLNWNIGLGALWVYALERTIDADLEVVGDHFLDSTYNALMLVSDYGVKDLYSISNVHVRDVRVDGTGTSVLSARVAGSATFQDVDARNVGAVGVNNCGSFHFTPAGSEFSLVDLGGNDSSGTNTTGPWLAPWELPNTITCDDRPPRVAPAAPSPWVG